MVRGQRCGSLSWKAYRLLFLYCMCAAFAAQHFSCHQSFVMDTPAMPSYINLHKKSTDGCKAKSKRVPSTSDQHAEPGNTRVARSTWPTSYPPPAATPSETRVSPGCNDLKGRCSVRIPETSVVHPAMVSEPVEASNCPPHCGGERCSKECQPPGFQAYRAEVKTSQDSVSPTAALMGW